MKKGCLICFAAGAAVLVSGCADDVDVRSGLQDMAVEFSPYIGRGAQTKSGGFDGDGSTYQFGGVQMDDAELKKTGFGVSAVYTGPENWVDWNKYTSEWSPNFMFKQKVYFDAESWKYEPVKYWPTMDGDKISFFAYAPFATESNTYGFARSSIWTATHYSLKFSIQPSDKADGMVDFVAAAAMDRTYKTVASDGTVSYGATVEFKFEHALTRLLFSAKTSEAVDSKTHIVITGASLVKGNYYYAQGTYYFTTRTKADGGTSYWGPSKASGTDFIENDYDLSKIMAFPGTAASVGGKTYSGGNALEIGDGAKPVFKTKTVNGTDKQCYLFLIPTSGTEVDPGIPENGAAVKFTYDIVTEDASLSGGYSCTSAEKVVYLPKGIMQKGKAYNITFVFNVDRIEVSADVEGWDDASAGA